MARLTRFETEDGIEILIETPREGEMVSLSDDGNDIMAAAAAKFESAFGLVKSTAASIARAKIPADGIEVEIALKASAATGFFLASADSEAQLKVKLTWSRKAETQGPSGPGGL